MMRKVVCLLVVSLISFSALYAQSSWEQTYTLLDDIELQLQQVQNTNDSLMKQNDNLENCLLNTRNDLQALRIITTEQNQLLNQWEKNCNEMMVLYKEQSALLGSCEAKLKIYKICIPVSLTVGVVAGAAIVWRICK